MAILTASEKLKVLATGKATLKELNELEKMAETEDAIKNEPIVKVLEQPGGDDSQPKEEPKEEPKEDEKDKRIAELEAQLKEAQADNVHANNGNEKELSFEEQLDTMFKDYKF